MYLMLYFLQAKCYGALPGAGGGRLVFRVFASLEKANFRRLPERFQCSRTSFEVSYAFVRKKPQAWGTERSGGGLEAPATAGLEAGATVFCLL